MRRTKTARPGMTICPWCGDETILSTATAPRQKMGVCPRCFENYRPPTEAQRGRVEAIVRAEWLKATGQTLEARCDLAVRLASKLVDAGYHDASDALLSKVAGQAVKAERGEVGVS